ncbi:MAG: proton-conducting transporter membrane subunit [Oceanipulchritudo sp.]
MIGEHLPIIVILTYCIAALLMPAAGLLHRKAPSILAFASGLAALVFSFMTLWKTVREGAFNYAVGAWPPPVGIELLADPLSAFFLVVINLVSTIVLFHAHFSDGKESGERSISYYACVMLMLGGFSGIVGTADLFNLFVFLEMSALAGYALLGNGSGRAAHSAFRYLILGTIGASFYLLGLGFIYVETGSLNMGDVSLILGDVGMQTTARIGFVFIIIGISLKMALLPLHQWLPDAYTDAPAMSTALIAPIGAKVAVYVLIRLMYDVFPVAPGDWAFPLHTILAIAGAAGIIWGSVMAIPQTNMKRMLAYSSVAQIGYIALGIGLATPFGYIGAVLHVFNHAIMKACLFLFSARLEKTGQGIRIDKLTPATRRRLSVSTACFVLAAISMIGLPPTAGFFSKWYLILGSLESGNGFYVVVILASSLLNAVYFFRIIERIYFGNTDTDALEPVRVRLTRRNLALVTLALSLLLAGLFNVWIVKSLIAPMVPAF